jgi:hypothetical protein
MAENLLKVALRDRGRAARDGEITGDTSVRELGELWLSEIDRAVQLGKRSPTTAHQYRYRFDRHVRDGLGMVRVRELTVARVGALHDRDELFGAGGEAEERRSAGVARFLQPAERQHVQRRVDALEWADLALGHALVQSVRDDPARSWSTMRGTRSSTPADHLEGLVGLDEPHHLSRSGGPRNPQGPSDRKRNDALAGARARNTRSTSTTLLALHRSARFPAMCLAGIGPGVSGCDR